MNRDLMLVLVVATMAGGAWAAGCGDGATDPPSPLPDPPRPTTIETNPATARLTALGTTIQLSAQVRDQNGQVMTGTTVTWASSASAVATVSAAGLVTASGNGTATITATTGGVSGTASVTVAQQVDAVAMSPTSGTLVAGDTLRLAVEASDANGHAIEETRFSWASDDTAVAVVDTTGLVTGVGAGTVEITATASGVTGGTELTVAAPTPTTVVVTPDTVTFTAIGQTAQLAAEVHDQNGRVRSEMDPSWSSSDTTIATASPVGLVTAVGTGVTTVTAMAGEAAGQATVTVMQSVDAVVVSPAAATVAPGDTLRLVAEAFDDNGHRVEGAESIWSSSDESVATVDSAGLVRARVRGDATIAAQVGTITGSANIAVCLPRIPPNFAVDEGTSHSLQFRGLYVSHAAVSDRDPTTIVAMAYADFDNDGRTDIFYSPLDWSPNPVPAEVYINDGRGGFDLSAGFFGIDPPGGVHPRKALPGDFNGDGKPDIFVLDHGYDREPFPGAHPYALLSSENGYVQAEGLADVIGFHHGGASADIDADGDLDVLVTDNFARPSFFVNDGAGNFVWDTTRVQGIEYTGIFTAELVDVDLDGYVDLLAAGHEYDGFATQILWGDQSGVFSTLQGSILPAIGGQGTVVDIDVADTDGDGDKDILLNRTGDDTGPGWYNGYYLQLLEQTGIRTFVDRTSLLHGNRDSEVKWIHWLRIADIDEDGDPDVLADDASRRLIWKNNGSGEFHPGLYRVVPPNHAVDEGTSHALQNPPFSVDHSNLRAGRPGRADAWAYGDFDGDGDIDIFYAPVDDPPRALPAELYLSDGNGDFSLDGGFMGGNPPALLGAAKALPGDYNGDGRLDVFVTGTGVGHGGEAPYVILSSGSGHVMGDALDDVAGVHFGAASADVDADGDLDVFLTDVYASDPPSVLLNNGRGSFGSGGVTRVHGRVEGLRQFLIVAELVDVDGDGYSDLLVGGHEYDQEPAQIIWGDSSGVYSTSAHTTLPAVAGHGVILDIDAGDFDRDGDMDIVVSRTGDETGPGFHRGYYLQLVDNFGARRFGDATTARFPGNRDDRAGSLRWIRIYDFDADADLDVVVDDYTGTDLVWRNDGAGAFRRGSQGR